jgi:hypothetical protein
MFLVKGQLQAIVALSCTTDGELNSDTSSAGLVQQVLQQTAVDGYAVVLIVHSLADMLAVYYVDDVVVGS